MKGVEHLHDAPGVRLEKITFSYSGEPLFSQLDFALEAGKWTCLLGPSGCGKSTLLELISGSIENGYSGTIRFGGEDGHRGRTAWMAQKDLLMPWKTVLENVMLGASLRGDHSEDKKQRAISLLANVGLGGCEDVLPAALSGGMRQRTALVRTLMEDRPVILMDEPFSALDALTRTRLQEVAANLLQHATVLLVTHDPLEALRLGHRVHVMNGRPAVVGEGLLPPGRPPRDPADPELAAMHAELLRQLLGKERS